MVPARDRGALSIPLALLVAAFLATTNAASKEWRLRCAGEAPAAAQCGGRAAQQRSARAAAAGARDAAFFRAAQPTMEWRLPLSRPSPAVLCAPPSAIAVDGRAHRHTCARQRRAACAPGSPPPNTNIQTLPPPSSDPAKGDAVISYSPLYGHPNASDSAWNDQTPAFMAHGPITAMELYHSGRCAFAGARMPGCKADGAGLWPPSASCAWI